jgi:cytochrome c oxidase subunit 2
MITKLLSIMSQGFVTPYPSQTNPLSYAFGVVWNDAPEPWQLAFQDGASPQFEGIVELHDQIMFYLVIILLGVGWMLSSISINFSGNHNKIAYKYHNHGTLIELIWTITPALILISVAFPSFKLLYLVDEVIDPAMTIKALGHQWYWSYEYSDFINEDGESIEFDSYMVPTEELEEGQLRLLEVDNRVVVPIGTHIRFIVTGADVIHSWAVPSLGLKIDAVPGRLNQTSVLIEREGVYYGQCSEICGVYHG